MATGLGVGADVEQALQGVGVPPTSRQRSSAGSIRQQSASSATFAAASSPPSSQPRTGPLPATDSLRRLGTSPTSEGPATSSTAGTRVPVEVSSVQLKSGETVVGVFGLIEERPDDTTRTPPPHLTPRSRGASVEQGRSTKQIAAELHLSTETVRNHIRRLFRALGVNSRLEAVAAARAASSD